MLCRVGLITWEAHLERVAGCLEMVTSEEQVGATGPSSKRYAIKLDSGTGKCVLEFEGAELSHSAANSQDVVMGEPAEEGRLPVQVQQSRPGILDNHIVVLTHRMPNDCGSKRKLQEFIEVILRIEACIRTQTCRGGPLAKGTFLADAQ